jgi:hypothetical protein
MVEHFTIDNVPFGIFSTKSDVLIAVCKADRSQHLVLQRHISETSSTFPSLPRMGYSKTLRASKVMSSVR